MNDVAMINFHDFVMMSGDKLVTDSRRVAKHFGKQHAKVLRAIRNLGCSEKFRLANFGECLEINKLSKKPEPFYTMTKDGFMFLVMRFTGQKAAEIQEAFINAFNWMAEQLRNASMGLWQQKQALIAKETESKAKGTYGSRLMLSRKKEIPKFREEHARLDSLIQIPLMLA